MTIPPLACTLVVYWFLSFPSAFFPTHSYFPQIFPGDIVLSSAENPDKVGTQRAILFPFLVEKAVMKVKSNLEKERNRTF